MSVWLTVVLMALTTLVAMAQQPLPGGGPAEPIFRQKMDSMAYAELESKIDAAVNAKQSRSLDSLMVARRTFLETHAFVWRYRFNQDRRYTPYSSLKSIRNPDSITRISIVGHGRRRLPDSLRLYKNLTELELIDFQLTRIPRRTLKNASITRLSIYGNRPRKPLRLPRNKSIVTLAISGDENGMLPRNYQRLKGLQAISLSRNNLTTIPDLSGARRLREIKLSGNNIRISQKRPSLPMSMTNLDLNGNSITVIPSWIGDFVNLKNLNVNNNQVSSIENGIGRLKHIEELSLYKNRLTEVPPVLYTLTGLLSIDLYYNKISKVDPQIANWKKMEILYLANNELYSVPEELGELRNLKELYLHHNRLSTLPNSIGNLKDLEVLRVNNNRMFDWPAGLFELSKLTNFDCSFNQFESMPVERFQFRSLRILAMMGNPWSESAREGILAWAESLRENETIVHLDMPK